MTSAERVGVFEPTFPYAPLESSSQGGQASDPGCRARLNRFGV